MPIESPWMTVKEAAVYAKRHENTIRTALADNTLRGSQRARKGTWLIHRDALDAYVQGDQAGVQVPSITRGKSTRKSA